MTTTLPHGGGAPPPGVVSEKRESCPPCRAAAASFVVALVGLRVCWLPGVNGVLAVMAIALGAVALWQIFRSHGTLGGVDEAASGIVLGVVVLGLSVFFLSALVAAWRR